MKKFIIFGSIAVLIFATFYSCRKNDGSTKVAFESVPVPKITKKSGTPAIDVLNLGNFDATFDVGLLFPDGIKPEKVDVVIRKNNDKSNIKVFKPGITTYPTSINIKAADLTSLFGTAIKLNDSYDISVDIYYNGKKYEAYPLYGAGWGSGLNSQAQVNGPGMSVNYSAICAYNAAIFQGDYVVVTDEWEDYVPGDVVTLNKVDETHFSFTHISAVNPIPISVAVNTGDNSVSIAKQIIGTRWAYGAAYTGPFISATGNVKPCDQTVNLIVTYGYSAGTWGGTYALVLKKK